MDEAATSASPRNPCDGDIHDKGRPRGFLAAKEFVNDL